MGRENWEFDRVPGSPKVIGSREGSVSLVVAGHCSRCGFMKKVKIKKTFKYALYDDGSNAYNFAIIK